MVSPKGRSAASSMSSAQRAYCRLVVDVKSSDHLVPCSSEELAVLHLLIVIFPIVLRKLSSRTLGRLNMVVHDHSLIRHEQAQGDFGFQLRQSTADYLHHIEKVLTCLLRERSFENRSNDNNARRTSSQI